MAVNQITQPKKEGGTWDAISKAMGFASTAVNIATGIDKLAGAPPQTPPQTPPVADAPPAAPIGQTENVLTRRRAGLFHTPRQY